MVLVSSFEVARELGAIVPILKRNATTHLMKMKPFRLTHRAPATTLTPTKLLCQS